LVVVGVSQFIVVRLISYCEVAAHREERGLGGQDKGGQKDKLSQHINKMMD
jgi:hypothetical protein